MLFRLILEVDSGSHPNVFGKMLSRESRVGRNQLGRSALEHDPATVMAGIGAEIDDPVGVGHHGLVVRDDDDRLAGLHQLVEKTEQVLDVGKMEPIGRLVDNLTAMTGRAPVEDVYRGYAAGDADCVAAVEHAATSLGRALANIVTVLGPEVIVIGGGPATRAGEVVLEPIRRATLRYVTLVPHEEIRIVRAELGSEAGAIGAVLEARSAVLGH